MHDISILIPTLQERDCLFQSVLESVQAQILKCTDIRVEVLWDVDNGEKTLGTKRNDLIARCSGTYHCFVDDDDILSPNYLESFIPMITSGIDYDCAALVGAYYYKGNFKKLFYHSLVNTEWSETPQEYLRSISPLNLIRTSIVRKIQYADIRNTEDHEFSIRLYESGLLKKEFSVDRSIPLYHYIDGVKDTRTEWSYIWNKNLLLDLEKEGDPPVILIKFPTRNRPQQFLNTLRTYIRLADDISHIKIMITLDRDDTSYDLHEITTEFPSLVISVGESKNKIDAINRDMNRAPPFDIVLLASDDMIPIKKGYDTTIRKKMNKHFPDMDGVLWFYDGYQKRINTLIVMGKTYFDRFGFLYNPVYKSFFCDNEFTDTANFLNKQIFIEDLIIKHEHPINTSVVAPDELYQRNDKYWAEDECTYETRNRKDYEFDISVLICTMPTREDQFKKLHAKLQVLASEVPSLKIEICSNAQMDINVGEKRDKLINQAKGKYSCFIDDDDDITDNYFKQYETMLSNGTNYDCFSLIGNYFKNGSFDRPFFHSIDHTSWYEDSNGFYRYVNHLNLIKTCISRFVGFKSAVHGEDKDFSMRLLDTGKIKIEGRINVCIYNYFYVTKVPTPPTVDRSVLLQLNKKMGIFSLTKEHKSIFMSHLTQKK
jgi:hypothetical protein